MLTSGDIRMSVNKCKVIQKLFWIFNPLTPEPPVTARAAWGTCARDAFPPISPTKQNFVSKLPLLLEDL